ncbi:MAG: phosphotransferase [Legionella sp.]|nr:phosphotransferase [Legionella sp.]
MSIFKNHKEKSTEWAHAKRALTGLNHHPLKNGSKLRRKDSGLNHSFMVINGRILAFNRKGDNLGKGAFGKAKLAEDETGRLFAVKVQAYGFSEDEAEVTYDLDFSGKKTKRDKGEKEYLDCRYLGRSLFDKYRGLNALLSLDERYAFLTKLALNLHALHTGSDSKTRTPYHHGDFHLRNIVLDDDNNPHIIDFGMSSSNQDLLKNKHGELINEDTQHLLQEFVYQALPYRAHKTVRDNKMWHGFMGEAMNESEPFFEYERTNENYIQLSLGGPKNEAGEYTCLHYKKHSLNVAESKSTNDLETGLIPLKELGLPPMKDDISLPSPLPLFYSIKDKVLEKIKANGHQIAIDDDAPDRNETLCRLANKGNATALEIAETLTLCRFNLEAYQEKLIKYAPKKRLITIKVLQANSELLLGLYELIRTTHGENSVLEAEIKQFLLDQIDDQNQEDNAYDAVKAFSGLEAPLTVLVQGIQDEKKNLKYEELRDQIMKNLVSLKKTAPPQVAEKMDTLYLALANEKDTGKTWLSSTNDFMSLMEHLSPEERQDMFEAVKQRLPELILIENRPVIFDKLKNALLQLIQLSWNLAEAIQPMPPEEPSVLFEPTLPRPKPFTENLEQVLKYLSPHQIEALSNELEAYLPSGFKLEETIETCKPKRNTVTKEELSEIKAKGRKAEEQSDTPSSGL